MKVSNALLIIKNVLAQTCPVCSLTCVWTSNIHFATSSTNKFNLFPALFANNKKDIVRVALIVGELRFLQLYATSFTSSFYSKHQNMDY